MPPGRAALRIIPRRGGVCVGWGDTIQGLHSVRECRHRGASDAAPVSEGSGTMRGNTLYSIVALIVIVILIVILLRVVGLI